MANKRVVLQLEAWRKELVNLNRTNRLLYYRPTKASSLELLGRTPDVLLANLESSSRPGWGFQVEGPGALTSQHVRTNAPDAKAQEAVLKNLERRATQEYLDKGLWILYVAVGMLVWKDPQDSREATSPLVLVPVTLGRETPRDPYRLRRADEDVVVNPALEVKLRTDFGLVLPGLDSVESGSLADYFAEVQSSIRDIESRIEERAVLAPFSFHKEVMYRDLLENAEQIAEHPVVQALADPKGKAGEKLAFDPISDDRLDTEAPPEQMVSVLLADASQRKCVMAAKAGKSFVMDGPPGTGKSQTITNIIAELLHDGRTVLFVSEKAAALEVVRTRLTAAGLGEYVLELHSHKATRKEVAQELGRALNYRTTPGTELSAADRRAVQQHRESLNDYAAAMNEMRPGAGRSLHDVFGRLEQVKDVVALTPPWDYGRTMTQQGLRDVLDVAGALSRSWGPVERGDDFLWREATGKRPRPRLLADAAAAVRALQQHSAVIAEQARVPRARGTAELRSQMPLLQLLADPPDVPPAWLTLPDLELVETAVKGLKDAQAEHAACIQDLRAAVGQGLERLDGDRYPHLLALVRGLDEQGTPPPDALGSGSATAVAAFLEASASTVKDLASRATRIAEQLGLAGQPLTIERARQVTRLATLAGAINPPEPQWLDPQVQDALKRAATVLQELVDEYRQREAALSDVFTPAVLQLDLPSLEHRFAAVHKGFRKWGGAYRADKRLLASATQNGKAKKPARSRLSEAREWQSLNRRLGVAEVEHASVLGAGYYQRTDTDFGAVVQAVEVARQAVELAGRDVKKRSVVDQLARGRDRDALLPGEATDLLEDLDRWSQEATEVLSHAPPAQPLEELAAWCSTTATAYRQISDHIVHVSAASAGDVDLETTLAALADRHDMQRLEQTYEAADAALGETLGPRYQGLETQLPRLEDDLRWVDEVRRLLNGPVKARAAQQMLAVRPDVGRVSADLNKHDKVLGELLALVGPVRRQSLTEDLTASFDDALAVLDELDSTVSDIDEWAAHVTAKATLASQGLHELVEELIELWTPADAVVPAVEKALLQAHVEHVLQQDRRLSIGRAADRDHLVAEFHELDDKLLRSASASIVTALNNRRPRTTTGVAGTIVREAQKKTRHMPVRKLIAETALVTQRLKPCFMMSPLTVSQFLTSDLSFDVVIFDEASQVLPADAVNCIYRGQQVVVAGDQKQLPPTSFFMGGADDDDDDYDDDQLDEFESVLDLCKSSGGFPSLPLLWHYRSQHESLITFSNYRFYEGSLISFPGALETAPDVGVELFHVPDGTYRRGGPRDNPKEAALVVDRVLGYAERHPELTCGVVAFSEAQASAIEIELDRRRKALPHLDSYFAEDRLGGFFVKNLENVQGDERDVIIFSIGYGPDEHRKLTMNFGPVNRKGGWRRLNVAITRARRRVEVVSSITADDIDSTNESVLALKRYLDYADRGVAALALDLTGSLGDADSPFEEEVARVIRGWGYDVVPQVGTAGYRIDMAVRHPQRPGSYALGIECDGVMYHSSKVARDRDRLREAVLRGLGWDLHRIWGTAWYRDRSREEERLHAAIEAAISGKTSKPKARRTDPEPVTPAVEQVHLDEAPAWAEAYVVHQPQDSSGYQITDPAVAGELGRIIVQVAQHEGPIHADRLTKRARVAFDVRRTGSNVRSAIDSAVARAIREGKLEQRGGFYAVPGGFPGPVRVPDPDDDETRRKVEEVSPEELSLAMRQYVFDAHAIDEESLYVAVARLYGWGRVGGDIRAALEEVLDDLLDCGLVGNAGGLLTPL